MNPYQHHKEKWPKDNLVYLINMQLNAAKSSKILTRPSTLQGETLV